MSFWADRQTTDDLNLLDRFRHNTVARLFDEVKTGGGTRLLTQLFEKPLTDYRQINERSVVLQTFTQWQLAYPFSAATMEAVEAYLSSSAHQNMAAAGLFVFGKKIMKAAVNDPSIARLEEGLKEVKDFLKGFAALLQQFPKSGNHPYSAEVGRIEEQLSDSRLQQLMQLKEDQSLSSVQLTRYDYLLKNTLHESMKSLMDAAFQLDVYIAVAGVAKKNNFGFARALPADVNVLSFKGMFHPCMQGAVGNSLHFDAIQNGIFLTGANMAGKSTLMKSLGINFYLAHMGFPVAASEMEFSVKDGIYSSINVPDNIDMGHSHFYAEVLRVKKVAEEVASGKKLLVIFDELFKGTNVKDAYDATLAITKAFGAYKRCFFMISTHIIEVGKELQQEGSNFQFSFLPTVMKGVTPTYTYQLENGITSDKQGMLIIENEGIPELLD